MIYAPKRTNTNKIGLLNVVSTRRAIKFWQFLIIVVKISQVSKEYDISSCFLNHSDCYCVIKKILCSAKNDEFDFCFHHGTIKNVCRYGDHITDYRSIKNLLNIYKESYHVPSHLQHPDFSNYVIIIENSLGKTINTRQICINSCENKLTSG